MNYYTVGCISAILFWIIVVIPYINRKIEKEGIETNNINEEIEEFFKIDQEDYNRMIEDSINETNLYHSGKMPTDEDIDLYYKMYLKKKELQDEWDVIKPAPFEKWTELAKDINTEFGGYPFMIRNTMDMFWGNGMMQRIHDYKKMVKEDEKTERNNRLKEGQDETE